MMQTTTICRLRSRSITINIGCDNSHSYTGYGFDGFFGFSIVTSKRVVIAIDVLRIRSTDDVDICLIARIRSTDVRVSIVAYYFFVRVLIAAYSFLYFFVRIRSTVNLYSFFVTYVAFFVRVLIVAYYFFVCVLIVTYYFFVRVLISNSIFFVQVLISNSTYSFLFARVLILNSIFFVQVLISNSTYPFLFVRVPIVTYYFFALIILIQVSISIFFLLSCSSIILI